MRKVYNLHTQWGELLLVYLPCSSALPITSDKHFMEPLSEPVICSELIFVNLGHHFVNVSDRFHDSTSVSKRNDGMLVLVMLHQFVGRDPDYQIIALLFGPFQNVEMSDVKHVVYAGGIALSLITSPSPRD